MKRFLFLFVLATLLVGLFSADATPVSANDSMNDQKAMSGSAVPVQVIESVRDGVSETISSSLNTAPSTQDLSLSDVDFTADEVPMFMREPDGQAGILDRIAGASSRLAGAQTLPSLQDFNGPLNANLLQVFDGVENDDNGLTVGLFYAPPDTVGDVGPNHYVQMTNVVTTIFDKSGIPILGPVPNNVFWSGLGGLCETTNRGDPIVLYDEESNRWLISQFAFDNSFTTFSLCVAFSTTGDPTGSYYQHEFDFTSIGFPDYPKYGFASDAISVMVNLFTPPSFGFGGTGLGAIDKAEAFSNQQTTMVFFNLGPNEYGFVAGDNDGPGFKNMPPTFATNNGGTGSTIDFWEITPKFNNPSKSKIAEVASIPVSPFDGDLCPAPRERCIDQPGSGTGSFPFNITYLEAITDRLMHRLQLRNIRDGNEKRAVVTHTVDVDGTGKAGIRWYEFRDEEKGWELYQEGTFSPDGDHRWMGSVAMNVNGDICVGYSISSQQTFTSIGAACQTKDEKGSGILNVGETVIFAGQNVQRQTNRWGDYSAMVIDPVDDTFWYTQEYAEPNQLLSPLNVERFGWATKIAQFQLP